MELREMLETLCNAPGISGNETNAAQTALEYLKEYAPDAAADAHHNVYGEVCPAPDGQPKVLLDAHIDEIGLIVTKVDSAGFLKAAACGGVDRRLLLGQEVAVYGRETLSGVIASMPPHLASGEKKVPEVDEILIDIGMDAEKAAAVVRPGDRATLVSGFHDMAGSRVVSHALDDRSGVAVLLRALELLKGKKLNCGLSVLFSAQEETGERGAAIAGYGLNPDIGIAVDVSFAHTPDADEDKCGKLGKGVMIGIAASLDQEISNTMRAVAEEKGIPYQTEVMGGMTGTNADAIGVLRGGARMGLLSIPLRYMHTPVEMIDLNDCEHTAQLLAAYIEQIGEGN